MVCAEGYLFELERRGYLQAGAFVPEIVLERPDLVRVLHEEFVHAGSDVVLAFTYYGHREKLRAIGKEDLLEPLNRGALRMAVEVARETATLSAGDLCNTNAFAPDDASRLAVRRMFEEQLVWIVEAGVNYGRRRDVLLRRGGVDRARSDSAPPASPAVVTLAIHQAESTRDGWAPEEACRRLADAGADVVGLELHPRPADDAAADRADSRRGRHARRRPPRPLPHHRGAAQLPVPARPRARGTDARAAVSHRA